MAPQPMTATRTTSSLTAPRPRGRARRRPQGPPHRRRGHQRRGRRPRAAHRRVRSRNGDGWSAESSSDAAPYVRPTSSLGAPKRAAVAAVASATSTAPATGVVHPVLLDRVSPAVDDGHRHQHAARRGRGHDAVADRSRPAELVLRGSRGRRLHAEAVLRRDDEVAEALVPAGLVVAVLADVGHAERVGDEEVLRVGRLAVGADHLGGDPRGEERADGGAGCGDPCDDHVRRRPATACRRRPGTSPAATPARSRPRSAAAAASSDRGARCSGSAASPRSTPSRPARAMPPGPPWSSREAVMSAPLDAHDGDAAAKAELLGLVDGALHDAPAPRRAAGPSGAVRRHRQAPTML